MKYNWDTLRIKFITKQNSDSKYTLKQFSIDENISYSLLRKKATGWITERDAKQEQKANKIIDKTLEKQADREAEMNSKHYEAAEKLIDVMLRTMDVDSLVKSPKSIATLAKALKDAQAVQRRAIDADKDGGKTSIIDDFIEAVEAVHNEPNTDTN